MRAQTTYRKNGKLLYGLLCWLAAGLMVVGCKPPAESVKNHPAEGSGVRQGESGRKTELDRLALSESQERLRVSKQWELQLASALKGEETIQITDAPVSVSQIQQIEQVPHLTDLLLDQGLQEETSLGSLCKFSSLEHLRIRHFKMRDSQLEQLIQSGCFIELEILNLPQAELTAQGISHLSAVAKLRQLRLGGRTIDDAACREIAKLPELRSLHLIGPQLTAQGILALSASPKLASFYLDDARLDSNAADRAWSQLFKAKPNLHVHIDQHHHDRDPMAHAHP